MGSAYCASTTLASLAEVVAGQAVDHLRRGGHLPRAEGGREEPRGEVGHLTIPDGFLKHQPSVHGRVGQRVARHQGAEVHPVGVIKAALQQREELRLQQRIG